MFNHNESLAAHELAHTRALLSVSVMCPALVSVSVSVSPPVFARDGDGCQKMMTGAGREQTRAAANR